MQSKAFIILCIIASIFLSINANDDNVTTPSTTGPNMLTNIASFMKEVGVFIYGYIMLTVTCLFVTYLSATISIISISVLLPVLYYVFPNATDYLMKSLFGLFSKSQGIISTPKQSSSIFATLWSHKLFFLTVLIAGLAIALTLHYKNSIAVVVDDIVCENPDQLANVTISSSVVSKLPEVPSINASTNLPVHASATSSASTMYTATGFSVAVVTIVALVL